MLGYFVRRLVGGVLTFLLAAFLMYTTFLYMPHSLTGPSIPHRPTTAIGIRLLIKSYVDTFELDRPWPLSFAAYLFDLGETTETDTLSGKTYPKGLRISILGMEIGGSGLLTGDSGRSLVVSRGEPVMDMIGPGLHYVLALLFSLMFTFMYVATVQRVGRPSPFIARHQFATLDCRSHLVYNGRM